MINPMDLSDKIVLVTGASSGMGRATCATLSQLGARVALVARSEKGLEETRAMMERPDEHAVFPYDLSNLDGIETLVKEVVAKLGKLDGFVHSAGLGTMKPLTATKPSFMEEMMRINLFAFIEITRLITMRRRFNAGLSIVAVSSTASYRGDKTKTAYCATKAGLDGAVRSLAIELGRMKGVRVNTVCPGWVRTHMYDMYVEATGDEKATEIDDRQFMGICEPEDVANLIAFLLGDVSRRITGQSILIDGGWTLL